MHIFSPNRVTTPANTPKVMAAISNLLIAALRKIRVRLEVINGCKWFKAVAGPALP